MNFLTYASIGQFIVIQRLAFLKYMNTLHTLQTYYILCINAVAFIIYGIDKHKAKKAKWRIPEATLLLLADLEEASVLGLE